MANDELSSAGVSELLGLALETAGMAVWEWNVVTGRVAQRVSRALDLGFGPGVAPNTVEGWLAHVHPADREQAAASVGECLRGAGEEFLVRLRIEDHGGRMRWLQVAGRVAGRDERGAPVRFIGTTQDVHHLQTVEETVRRDAKLFNTIPDSVVCTDADGLVSYWNDGATALYGFSAEEMLGRHIQTRLPAAAAAEARHSRRPGESDEPTSELLDYRKDGSRVWVETRVARYETSSGSPGSICFARDVSKRREAQELLQRDASILSQLQDIVVCLDLNGYVTYWNDAAERILGWKRQEIVGKHVTTRVPAEYAAQLNAGLVGLLGGKPSPPREWQDFRKDGSPVWILWRSEPLRDRQGKAYAVTAIGTDVTERRSAEEQRRQLETQLFHAQKMESLGTMAGGIAHDFNNTLAVILVYAELALAQATLPDDLKDALQQIQRAGGRARDLVARLLTFSRVQEPQRHVVDLQALLLDYAKLLRATLPSSIQLFVEAHERLPIWGDENQVHQLLLNLSSNAAQAMNDRGTLRIRLGRERIAGAGARPELALDAGEYAVISVADEGCGMTPEIAAHIFEPFFTTKPVGKGTGLGLATTAAIVKSHGGGIEVTSTPGAGSCFRIYLPLGGDSPTLPLPPDSKVGGHGQRVLVVDDEETVALLTRTALEALGYYAECVFSPEQFLERFLSAPERWDLLVADQTMPRLTGLQLCERVRSLGHATPIVLASGFSRQLTAESLLKVGPARLLKKPFDLLELGQAIGAALSAGARSVQTAKGS